MEYVVPCANPEREYVFLGGMLFDKIVIDASNKHEGVKKSVKNLSTGFNDYLF